MNGQRMEVQPMPVGADYETLPEGLYDTGERRSGKEYDIYQDEWFHDCTSRKLIRADSGTELPIGLQCGFRPSDGKRFVIAWDIMVFGETVGNRARRLESEGVTA